MKQEVLLEIRGMIEEKQTQDQIDLVTRGHLYEKGDSFYIVYKEAEMMGMKDCTTTLKIEDKKITLLRYGEANSQMIFEPYVRHVNAYDTPYGTLAVGVRAQSMEVDLSLQQGGHIEIAYDLDVNNMYNSSNTLSIQVDRIGEGMHS